MADIPPARDMDTPEVDNSDIMENNLVGERRLTMEYSLGPWEAKVQKAARYWKAEVRAIDNQLIAVCYGKNTVANAHLLSAAPEMYETGRELLKVMCELCIRLNPQHENCQSCEEIEGYRRAFAKAEGK